MKLSIFIFLLMTASLFAQSSENVRIPHPPQNAHWIITYNYTSDGERRGSSAALPQKSEYIITDAMGSEQSTFSNGETEQSYQMDGYQLKQVPSSDLIALSDLAQLGIPEYQKVYPGLDGIRADSLTGTVTDYGQECFHFRNGAHEVWVSVKTNLPVAFKDGGTVGRYEFLDPPVATIQLPPLYQRFVDKHFHAGPPAGEAASLRF